MNTTESRTVIKLFTPDGQLLSNIDGSWHAVYGWPSHRIQQFYHATQVPDQSDRFLLQKKIVEHIFVQTPGIAKHQI